MTSPAINERILLFVVGMHRSGTSALAASLHDCGASVGDALLPAQASVNEDGFWEDISVVALNERLLAVLGWTWYAVGYPEDIDWTDPAFKSIRQEAEDLLRRGFGEGVVQLVKDPRFCLTLPLWLEVCEKIDLPVRLCTIDRPVDAVARSLQKRDEFPLSYGRWLHDIYLKHRDALACNDIASVSFAELLSNPQATLQSVIDELSIPLEVNAEKLDLVVRTDLNHAGVMPTQTHPEEVADSSASVPLQMLQDFVKVFVRRGQELTQIAEQHTHALSVVAERDTELASKVDQLQETGQAHGKALETIKERDAQLTSANANIQELGDAHGYAISVVQARDAAIVEVQSQFAEVREQLAAREHTLDQTKHALAVKKGKVAFYEVRIERLVRIPLFGLLVKKYFTHE